MRDWDVGFRGGSGYPGTARVLATTVTADLPSRKQDNSHPGWFSSQVILSRCGHRSIKVLSEVRELPRSGGGGCAGVKPGTGRSCTGAAAPGPAAS